MPGDTGRGRARESWPRSTDAWLERVLGERMRRYDKGGDSSTTPSRALHKSVRGSDPDAALYWLVRMLDGGADPRYMARRLVRMASEDIGLADPRALRMALDAAETYERLGSPEGELALAQCVVYLAVAPKSNAVYKAFNEVRAFVKKDGTRPVPLHLRNAPTQLMKTWTTARATATRTTRPAASRPANATCPTAWPTRAFTGRWNGAWRSVLQISCVNSRT
jgi:putative ATPase